MISDPKGYYAVLELHPSASPALIRAAYRVRAMQLHPDRSDSLSSTLDFQRLQEAFEVLGDPERKAAYDEWCAQLVASSRQRAAPKAEPAPTRQAARFAVPAGALGLAVIGVVGWLSFGGEPARSNPPTVAALKPAAQTDPVRLLANTQPLPTNGILQLNLPSEAFAHSDTMPRLRLGAPRDASYLVKLSAWDSDATAMTVFVRAGESTEVLVPTGRYHVRLASGVEWFGDKLRFGPNTQYSQVDTLSEFQSIGDRPVRLELTLDNTATPIAAAAF